jgi:hypothetical protein
MSVSAKVPPYRSLDIYRLVVARGLKQAEVASLFNVTPVRICQICRRVRRWVDQAIGDWLFPRRDDLRFYVALETEQIRVHELENEPQTVLFTGPGLSYRREVQPAAQPTPPAAASHDGNVATSLTTAPIKSLPCSSAADIDATLDGATDFASPHVNALAHRLAELLIVWQKSRALTGSFKSPSLTGA